MQNVSSSNSQGVNVPKLRFPGFEDEWQVYPLSELFSKITNKNKNGNVTNVISNSAKNGLIPQTDYFDKEIANSNNTSGYYIIKNGDFVYNPRKSAEAPFGPISVYEYAQEGIVSPLYLCFRSISHSETDFYKWLFKSSVWHKYIYLAGDSGARFDRVSMRDDVFFAMPIKVPSVSEQIKISHFLNIVDNLIQKQTTLVETLKLYKRGVSEAIFSQKLHLSKGVNHEKWTAFKLSEMGAFYNGLSGKTKDDFGHGNGKFVTYMNVFTNPIADSSLCELVEIAENEHQNHVEYGDLLFTQSSETLNEVGMTSVWLDNSTPCLNSFCFGFRFNSLKDIDPLFFAYYMRSYKVRKAIVREGQGATRINLSAERIKNIELTM